MRKDYVKALIKQVEMLEKPFETVYIGGGTPSMLPPEDLRKLILAIRAPKRESAVEKPLYGDRQEFTIECNPDDVTPELAELLFSAGVNRVSLGVQTFSDKRLKQINRRHDAAKAVRAVETLRGAGMENISIDLMYGFPAETQEEWKADIEQAVALKPQHISAYCLSVEKGTALARMLEEGALPPLPTEETLADFYFSLVGELKKHGYEHYEISNFCLPGHHSRHNSGYWQDKPYIALGAGAHGYIKDGATAGGLLKAETCGRPVRYWNVRDIPLYINNVYEGKSVVEGMETIDPATHYNDLITTAMRTSRGLSAEYVRENCSPKLADYFQKTAERLQENGLVDIRNGFVSIAEEKLFVSDDILSELIFPTDD